MRLLICGGRGYAKADNVRRAVLHWHAVHPDLVVICGYDPADPKFQGADQLAYRIAKMANIRCEPFPAEWKKYGKSAGPRRNQRMLDEGRPDHVLAFPGGRGTRDMVKRAKGASVEVTELET